MPAPNIHRQPYIDVPGNQSAHRQLDGGWRRRHGLHLEERDHVLGPDVAVLRGEEGVDGLRGDFLVAHVRRRLDESPQRADLLLGLSVAVAAICARSGYDLPYISMK